ncbi:MAG TPA: response regulator transcription factor [Mucilaginibacter sp.]|jgi:DNA-binding NarL/FixJ family response regulator|nr:response regulator transcription factor [Mucilaginibacter sp.]
MANIPLINILIIEDDLIHLETYQTLIDREPGLHISGTYTSFENAEKKLLAHNPDVILLDVQLQGISGIDAIPLIRSYLPKVSIIILTVFESEKQIFQALNFGAAGYLTKDSSASKIVEAIKEVNEGGAPMSKKIARIVIKSFEKNPRSPLSKRETEILGLIMEGKKRNEIGEALFIARDTVKTHIKNIYTKLNVNSRSHAIQIARKDRLV